jgi:ornithine carrier protein
MVERYKDYLYFIYGSFAGILGTVLLYPTYLIKRILQANSKNLLTIDDKNFKVITHMTNLYQRHGIKGFYLGLSMTLLKTGPYIGLTFWCNERLKKLFKYEK